MSKKDEQKSDGYVADEGIKAEAAGPMKVTAPFGSGTFAVGGLEPRYIVTRADGSRISGNKRYFVLNYNGQDPHALRAMLAYAESVEGENSQLATDLREAIRTNDGPPQHETSDRNYGPATSLPFNVIRAIDGELEYAARHTLRKTQFSYGEYLPMIRHMLQCAEEAWYMGTNNPEKEVLEWFRKIAAMASRALIEHGVVERTTTGKWGHKSSRHLPDNTSLVGDRDGVEETPKKFVRRRRLTKD